MLTAHSKGGKDQLVHNILWSTRNEHQLIDPIPVFLIRRRRIRVLNPGWRQVVAGGLTEHSSPRHSHEAVVDHALLASVSCPHCREDLSLHEVILDSVWQ